MFDSNVLWPQPTTIEITGEIDAPERIRFVCPDGAQLKLRFDNQIPEIERDLSRFLGGKNDASGAPFTIAIRFDTDDSSLEAYKLTLGRTGGEIVCAGAAGFRYAAETLIQIAAGARQSVHWPELEITDCPAYRKRCFMADMGRSTFSLDMLKRIVRILMHLKMNQLHLHMYDDELCGIRFDGLPFGSENPYAITLAEFSELVQYAQERHVEVVPEFEGWGHVGSLVHYRPKLRGGQGMYAGSSFLVGEESFSLMQSFIEQIMPALPSECTVHLGLDEAKWFPASDQPDGFTPEHMVGRYYEILTRCAEACGKHATLRLWADHAGRPVPPEIIPEVIIEPWQYWIAQRASMDRAIGRYAGPGKSRFMMGAGQSVGQFRGAYHATCYWCRAAVNVANVEGINITFWGRNDLERNFISLFAGAGFAWTPFPKPPYDAIDDYEAFERVFFPHMQRWQTWFRDAYPDDLRRDQGPSVVMGRYLWGDRHGTPVGPCVVHAHTGAGHDYLNEV